MRLRLVFHTILGSVLGALIAGCSSQTGVNSVVPQTSARTDQSISAYPIGLSAIPIGLSAYPAGLSAYPITLGAFPVSISAYPINIAGLSISGAATAACQATLTA